MQPLIVKKIALGRVWWKVNAETGPYGLGNRWLGGGTVDYSDVPELFEIRDTSVIAATVPAPATCPGCRLPEPHCCCGTL